MLKGHRDVVLCLQYNEEVIISGSHDYTVKLVHPSLSVHVHVLAYVISLMIVNRAINIVEKALFKVVDFVGLLHVNVVPSHA